MLNEVRLLVGSIGAQLACILLLWWGKKYANPLRKLESFYYLSLYNWSFGKKLNVMLFFR